MKKININIELILVLYFITYIAGLLFFIGLNHPFWTDEHHFYTTIKLFYESISINNLKHYNEMSTPFPFIIYSLWAKIGGLNLAWLRILSIIVALLTYLMFFKVLINNQFNKRKAAFSTIFISLNPYMIGTSFFVYTDMITVFCIVTSIYFFQKNNIVMVSICCAFALWCRQYAVYYIGSLCIYYFLQYVKNKQIQSFWNSIIIGSSIFSLVPLLFLWRDLSPVNDLKSLYLDKTLFYQFNGLSAYVISIAIYCFPLVCIYLFKNRQMFNIYSIFLFVVFSFYYVFFPIAPSECGIEAGFINIGFADKILHKLISNVSLIHIIYQVLFCLGLTCIWILYVNAKRSNLSLLSILCIILFLLVMPFSYLVWEKYLLPLLPILIISLLQTIDTNKKENRYLSY